MKRNEVLSSLSKNWDIIIIGGGITGAGVFNESSKLGISTLLLEQKDFGWGTSSRSGKLVHGGLRYLKQGQFKTTWHSVKEREHLLNEYNDLIEPLRFLYPTYKGDMSPTVMKFGLNLYDLMAGRRDYQYYDATNFHLQAPLLSTDGLTGGLSFTDAITDDARLVLRVIEDGKDNGGVALNYVEVRDLIKESTGRVVGVIAIDKITGEEYEIFAQVVVNATGVFADNLRSKIDKKPILRKLRGSHIIFPQWRFPVYQAISFSHPEDQRPLYVLPWNGVTLYGTTDLEHELPLEEEPKIFKKESDYLFAGLDILFPSLKLTKEDVISTFSGMRSVLDTGKKDPSKEARDYIILSDNGLITVTGGKLTTFKLLAIDALKEAKKYIDRPINIRRVTKPIQSNENIAYDNSTYKRLKRTFGTKALDIYKNNEWLALGYIGDTNILWAELFYSAINEQVVHLEDLLLRRSRIGLITPSGGIDYLDEIGKLFIEVLGFDQVSFEKEKSSYLKLWEEAYSPKLL